MESKLVVTELLDGIAVKNILQACLLLFLHYT